ncbi:MAG TPA: hypothetical protein VFL74_06545 [Sphingomicrobium sp.]|nr:hypothetical protein [Sphingomicrobium sp.]
MSIIPSFGSPPGPVNLTSGQYVGGDFTIASGAYAGASSIFWMYDCTDPPRRLLRPHQR